MNEFPIPRQIDKHTTYYSFQLLIDMSGPNFVTTNANVGDVDSVAKEARKKKIKELEESLFGSENNADLLWNPRYSM